VNVVFSIAHYDTVASALVVTRSSWAGSLCLTNLASSKCI